MHRTTTRRRRATLAVLSLILSVPTVAVARGSASASGPTISTVAGTGAAGYGGDGGIASGAVLDTPVGVAVDLAGNVYIADMWNHRIRRVDASTGLISTVAGNGTWGFNGDGITATTAALSLPTGVAVDASGDLYIAELGNNRVRRVDAATGLISTVAGTGAQGYNGDGIAATSAQLDQPADVAIDATGNVYIADTWNHAVRRVDAATGLISTVAGAGLSSGLDVDGIPATSAWIEKPAAVVVAASGDLYFADDWGGRVRRVDAATGLIWTVAGMSGGSTADGVLATTAQLSGPAGIDLDAAGDLYIAESGGARVRRVDASTGLIWTAAGTGSAGFNGDGIDPTTAQLDMPGDVAASASGDLLVADIGNDRVRRVSAAGAVPGGVSGSVLEDGTGSPLPGISVRLLDATTGALLAVRTTKADGSYSFASVDPGDHLVRFIDVDGSHVGEWYDDALGKGAATTVTVVGGSTALLSASLAPSSTGIVGTVREDGSAAPLSGISVRLLRTDNVLLAVATTDAAGAYSFGSVSPGDYLVRFIDLDGSHVGEFHLDAPTRFTATTVTATQAATLDVSASLAAS